MRAHADGSIQNRWESIRRPQYQAITFINRLMCTDFGWDQFSYRTLYGIEQADFMSGSNCSGTGPDPATTCSSAEHLPAPKQELNWERNDSAFCVYRSQTLAG
jgi:hypothetical protein